MSELFSEVQDALAAKDAEISALEAALELEHEETKRLREIAFSLRAAWKIAEPHLPQDVYRRALAALDASR